jgi:hypothetical protein
MSGSLAINGTTAVVGSGTANYVPKFTASGTIGNSQIFDNGSAVGIGNVSLSAWISTAKALQINNTTSLFAPSSEAILGNNVFVDSTDNNKYITTNFASMYRQVDGKHLFYSAASGTAGNTISFGTPKLTILSDGAATFSSTVTAKNALILTPEVSGNYETNGALSYYSTTNGVYLNGAGASGWLRLNAAGSENNQTTIDLYGSTQSTSPSTILFRTANSERMRIPSTGGILVGQESKWNAGVDNSFRTGGASSWTLNANSLNTGSPYLLLITTGRNTSSDLLINCETNHASLGGSATTGRFRVDGAGIIYATNTTVQSISDIRTKENIIDAESGLNIINNLKVRRFDFKDGFGDNKKNQLGFIAQEIETVFPEAVGLIPKTSDSQDNDIQYKTVGPGALIPVLTKAIQELKSENDTLKEILQRNNIQ